MATSSWAAPSTTSPIVNGTLVADFPAVGALVFGTSPDVAQTLCSGVLIGCSTFLTAAHCVCEGDGASCQGSSGLSPGAAFVYLDHAGFVPIERIALRPDYVFPVADIAVVHLATPVTGIVPMAIIDASPPPFGTQGTIVGYGVTTGTSGDSGLKRAGGVVTAPCVSGIVDATSVCWDFTGAGANTCDADSGGPLFVDLGTGPVVAGVTSGGFSATCLPTDHSYDASVAAYRDWIAAETGGDLGTTACGALPAVGTPGAVATAFVGELGGGRPFALHSVGVAPGTNELRVAMHGSEDPGNDFDLYLRHGAAPAAGAFDCDAVGTNQYGFCRVENPAPGSWFVRAERVGGGGIYQIVATTFGGEAPVCGNALREPGEDCDGVDVGTCTTGCDASCSCVQCSSTDLDVRQIQLAPRLFVQAILGDGIGSYTMVDPPTGGVRLAFKDAIRTIELEIPTNDPGWVVANPRQGRYRWRGDVGGLRRLLFRTRPKRPTEWILQAKGHNVDGAAAIDYGTLTARVQLGQRCAERRFHVEQPPAVPRP